MRAGNTKLRHDLLDFERSEHNMFKYVLKRIGLMLLSAFIIMTMLFILIKLLPNTVVNVQGGFAEQTKAMYEAWGYNEPIMVQYGIFLKKVFLEYWHLLLLRL